MNDPTPTSANSLVVMLDVQGKLALSMFDRARLFGNLQRLLKALPSLDVPLLVLEQTPEKLGPTLPLLGQDIQSAPVFAKRSFSACGQVQFRECLKEMGRSMVFVAGIETHVCVYQTVRDLCSDGLSVSVIADAVSSRSAANYRFGLDMCRDLGATITTTESILFEWLKTADHPAFRQVLKLVR